MVHFSSISLTRVWITSYEPKTHRKSLFIVYNKNKLKVVFTILKFNLSKSLIRISNTIALTNTNPAMFFQKR